MNNHSTTDEKSKTWPSWLVLFIRWLLGGFIGFAVSIFIFLGFMNGTFFAVLFIGHLLMFDPSFLGGKNWINFLVDFFPNIDQKSLVMNFPALIWGLIGALLASGRSDQVKTGAILLGLIVIVGFISFFRMVMMVPI